MFPFDQDFAIEVRTLTLRNLFHPSNSSLSRRLPSFLRSQRPTRVLRKGLEAVHHMDKNKNRDDWGSIVDIDEADQREELRLAALEGDIHGLDKATIGSLPEDKAAVVSSRLYLLPVKSKLKPGLLDVAVSPHLLRQQLSRSTQVSCEERRSSRPLFFPFSLALFLPPRSPLSILSFFFICYSVKCNSSSSR